VKKLLFAYRNTNNVRLPNATGIAPVNKLSLNEIYTRTSERAPSEDGSVPVRQLRYSDNSRKNVISERESGIVPLRIFS